jgi:hypothetical protein
MFKVCLIMSSILSMEDLQADAGNEIAKYGPLFASHAAADSQ